MYNKTRASKIKNDKIARWRVELSGYAYDVVYRPGKENVGADTLSRANVCAATRSHSIKDLEQLHDSLCHPGITRLYHYVKSKNLPFSLGDVKSICEPCDTCMKEKPRFIQSSGTLIKATQPFQQLNIDFKGPLPSSSGNRYILTLVDEYSRFPFAFPCRDMTSQTVIKCFNQLFSLFGMPNYIHNDRAQDFLSSEVKTYLNSKGIAMSKTSRYNPRGNGQAERYNGIIWKTVRLALTSKKMPLASWESVLPDALHSIRSLLCTATNETPHERLFSYNRKSATGCSIPSWLTPGRIYVRNHARNSKHDPAVVEAELLQANPQYAFVRLDSGHETTVSLRDVAPCKRSEPSTPVADDKAVSSQQQDDLPPITIQQSVQPTSTPLTPTPTPTPIIQTTGEVSDPENHALRVDELPRSLPPPVNDNVEPKPVELRRSTRIRKNRELFADSSHSCMK